MSKKIPINYYYENVQKYKCTSGLPSIMNLAPRGDCFTFDKEPVPIPEACKRLQEAGADVVGINCFAGPDTIIPMIKKVKGVVGVSTN